MKCQSDYPATLAEGFQLVADKQITLDEAHNRVHRMLHAHSPQNFLYGPLPGYLDALPALLLDTQPYGRGIRQCLNCNYLKENVTTTFTAAMAIAKMRGWVEEYPEGFYIQHWFKKSFHHQTREKCPACFANN